VKQFVTFDYETRSAAELRKVGGWVYSLHPSTVVLCAAFKFGDEDEVYLWHPAIPALGLAEAPRGPLRLLHQRVQQGWLVKAHNAFFERAIWTNICIARYGWPAVNPRQWRCTAAKAASYNLPRKLEDACNALGLAHKKDSEGHRIMLQLSKPRSKGTKADPYGEWHYDAEKFKRLFDYCRQDVRAEHSLDMALRDLPEIELETWLIDQEINVRGVQCDDALARRALQLAEARVREYDLEVKRITGGTVANTRARDALTAWTEQRGWPMPGTAADVIDAAIPEVLDEDIVRVLELWRSANRTSTKKYAAMILRMAEDGRIRDLLMYHGAGTGRWAGRGIQPQNFPRGSVKGKIDVLCDAILAAESPADLDLEYGDAMKVLSTALRGALIAGPGMTLAAADYATIEVRVTFWLAGADAGLELFRRGEDVYKDMASTIFSIPIAQIEKDSRERQVGKAAVLGLGFQMGWVKFQGTAAKDGVTLDDAFSAAVVAAYREKYWQVKDLWYEVERAAIRAIELGDGAEPVWCARRRVAFAVRGRFLHCRLPSGRLLSYLDPTLQNDPKFNKVGVTFMGVDDKGRFARLRTYGGSLVENIVQATARDVMRDALLRLDRMEGKPYKPVLSVHDELVSEVKPERADLAEYCTIMSTLEPWAEGLPVKAEGWIGRRYRK
jgi:DNA polymerase